MAVGSILQFSYKSIHSPTTARLEAKTALLECGIHFGSDTGELVDDLEIWNVNFQCAATIVVPAERVPLRAFKATLRAFLCCPQICCRELIRRLSSAVSATDWPTALNRRTCVSFPA